MDLLEKRLQNLWQKPDFYEFFGKFVHRTPLKIKKGTIIFFEGDQPNKIYFVKKGFVKMYRSTDGSKDSIVYLYGPGNILGIRALTSKDEVLKHSAESLTDCEILTLSREDYIKILHDNPYYILDLLYVFIERLNYTERKLEGFISTDTLARVSNFIRDLALRFGEKDRNKISIPIPLSHQRIAEFVGAYRETVTISINKLINDKVITRDKSIITVINLKKLEELSKIQDNL